MRIAYRFAELPLSPPEERLGETPELLDPLGLRARAPPSEDGVVEPLRGRVLDDPGRLRVESVRWKLGVRRTIVGVFIDALPSVVK